jgi:hypothetical protein
MNEMKLSEATLRELPMNEVQLSELFRIMELPATKEVSISNKPQPQMNASIIFLFVPITKSRY